MIKIYHNPKCSKSRAGLKYLMDNGIEVEVIDYIKNPISVRELKDITKKLNIKPLDLIRKKEEVFVKEYKNKSLTDDEWLIVMTENPRLIERPVVINGNKAVVARPTEKIEEIL
jgi:arsenate reductase